MSLSNSKKLFINVNKEEKQMLTNLYKTSDLQFYLRKSRKLKTNQLFDEMLQYFPVNYTIQDVISTMQQDIKKEASLAMFMTLLAEYDKLYGDEELENEEEMDYDPLYS